MTTDNKPGGPRNVIQWSDDTDLKKAATRMADVELVGGEHRPVTNLDAQRILADLIEQADRIHPDTIDATGEILRYMDQLGIYGERIQRLYRVGGNQLHNLMVLLLATKYHMLGMTPEMLNEAIDSTNTTELDSIKLKQLLTLVQARFPSFNPDA